MKNECIEILECLRKNFYSKTQVLPTRRNLWNLPFEYINLFNFVLCRKNQLFEWSVFPNFYYFLFKLRYSKAFLLFKVFFLNTGIKKNSLSYFFTEEQIIKFLDKKILFFERGKLKSSLKFIPLENDIIAFFNHQGKSKLWLGRDSVLFADFLTKELKGKSYKRALDLCTGTGIQAVRLSETAERVVGTDINIAAVENARLNASLLGKENKVSFFLSDLFKEVNGKFDLVTANPPYGIFPDSEQFGLKVVFRLLDNIDDYLEENGTAYIVTESVVKDRQDLLINKLKDLAYKYSYSIRVIPIWYSINRHFFQMVHKKMKVAFIPFYFVKIEKNNQPALIIEKLNLFKKASNFIYIFLNYMFFSGRHKDNENKA